MNFNEVNNMSKEYFDDEDRDRVVGAAVYQFGMFESHIWDGVIEFSRCKESFDMFKKSTRGGIKAALDLLTGLIINHVYPVDNKPSLDEFFEMKSKISKISKLFNNRNTIAHNPIEFWFDLYSEDDTIYNGTRVSKVYPDDLTNEKDINPVRLNLEEIEEITTEVASVRNAFIILMNKLSPYRSNYIEQ